QRGRVLGKLPVPATGHFTAPAVLSVNGIEDLDREIFGPVLHVATFAADEIDAVVDAVNAKGFGLTFGLHTRIDDRVQQIVERVKAGNIYVNRNQIGAVVGSQPFGGEGLSGTGPKAGGPAYLARFRGRRKIVDAGGDSPAIVDAAMVTTAIRAAGTIDNAPLEVLDMPGPTGESNRLSHFARGVILCLGPSAEAAEQQAERAAQHGNTVIAIADGLDTSADKPRGSIRRIAGTLDPAALADIRNIAAVISWAAEERQRALRKALAEREGPIVPLIDSEDGGEVLVLERHLCVDTTAAGGNASLLAASEA
ncbi:MAG: aldehyde dehydrogenase family protein, partial [Geminicoccaceae bacterium]|nr:aldehyde dehydrogenase family protein [Geminicoccaceae bacterium]